jgi:hypothetical protein
MTVGPLALSIALIGAAIGAAKCHPLVQKIIGSTVGGRTDRGR